MRMPRLVATDLDGTLLGPDGHLSDRTRRALARAAQRGVTVIAATGRSRLTALPRLDGVEGIRWVVCSNGAMVWDRERGAFDTHRPMTGPVARDVIRRVRGGVAEVAVGWETPHGFGFDLRFAQRPPTIDEYSLRSGIPEPSGEGDITKLVISVVGLEGAENMERAFRPHIPHTVTAAASGNSFMEVTAAGVHKASTLALIADRLGIGREDVAAFGDQHNDLEMLRWAGVGVAMANARPDVISAADRTAPANADDGVAQLLEEWYG